MHMKRVLSVRVLGRALALAGALAASSCVTNPETGRSQLLLVDDAQLAQMAVASWTQLKANTPISRDAAMNARLRRVGERIRVAAGRGGEAWEYVVFDSNENNAFVLPGGKVGVYRGLMQLTENDDQLAAIVGHETGHVVNHHAAERASQAMAADLGGAALGASRLGALGQQVFGLGVQYGVLLPYSRVQETEADTYGVDLMHRAGYDVRQAIRLWELMARAGGSRAPEFLSTHPDPANRIQVIRAHIISRGYARL